MNDSINLQDNHNEPAMAQAAPPLFPAVPPADDFTGMKNRRSHYGSVRLHHAQLNKPVNEGPGSQAAPVAQPVPVTIPYTDHATAAVRSDPVTAVRNSAAIQEVSNMTSPTAVTWVTMLKQDLKTDIATNNGILNSKTASPGKKEEAREAKVADVNELRQLKTIGLNV